MLQAECALRATARPRWAAASGTPLGGARGGLLAYGSSPRRPSRGRGKWYIRKRWPSSGRMRVGARRRRTHAPAVGRQADKLQHHLVARRKERAGRKPRAHTAPQWEE